MQTQNFPLVRLSRPGLVFAHYAIVPGIGVQVVTSTGKILGPSFFSIRHSWLYVATLAGRGLWVALAPAANQPGLF